MVRGKMAHMDMKAQARKQRDASARARTPSCRPPARLKSSPPECQILRCRQLHDLTPPPAIAYHKTCRHDAATDTAGFHSWPLCFEAILRQAAER